MVVRCCLCSVRAGVRLNRSLLRIGWSKFRGTIIKDGELVNEILFFCPRHKTFAKLKKIGKVFFPMDSFYKKQSGGINDTLTPPEGGCI